MTIARFGQASDTDSQSDQQKLITPCKDISATLQLSLDRNFNRATATTPLEETDFMLSTSHIVAQDV